MSDVSVDLGERSYIVHVGRGILEAIPDDSRGILVTDANVGPLWGERVAAESRLVVPTGEAAKSLASIERLYDALLDIGVERNTTVTGLGGGAVLDAVGFAAATLLRGIPLVLVPTTLLAQVDAAVGGKNGINHRRGKNLIGTFHQPKAVYVDVATLATLPEREYRSGFSEIIKIAAIRDAELFSLVERNVSALLNRDLGCLEDVVSRAVANKAAVVSADERESGLRRTLNFGHTIGHAIEQVTDYRALLHGEAVAIGMNAALHVGVVRGRTSAATRARIVDLCAAFGLPIGFSQYLSAPLGAALRHDKKTSQGGVNFVLVTEIGASIVERIEPSAIEDSFRRASS